MKFAEPIWLLIGALACLGLAWRYRRFDRSQASLLSVFVSPRLATNLTRSFSPGKRRFKRTLFLAATACLFIALAQPQAGYRWEETQRKGIEIMFAVDTSKSMLAQDVKPNRLTRAKLAVEDLLANLNGDGVGLVAFAGSAFLQCPITLDYDAFRDSVDSLDTSIIPRGGTDIAAAIKEAQTAFKKRAVSDRILILITDGEDLGDEGIAAAKAAAKDGTKIFTVGVGSASGELIPIDNGSGGTEFIKDVNGQFVKSRLDDKTLKQIAEATGGMYQPLGQQGQGLETIYEQGLKPFTRHDLASRQHKVYREQFQWPLTFALLLFLIEPLIGTRRKAVAAERKAETKRPILRPFSNRPAGAMVALLLIVSAPRLASASPGSAEKAYKKGEFKQAADDYAASLKKQPANAQLQFNSGAAAYKAGQYDTAQTAFQNALKTEEIPVQQSAYYNLGNAQYRLGEQALRGNPQSAIKTWQEAVNSYDAALQIKPDDADAKYNRDLVKRRLEQLQKQQQQQQNKQDKNDKQKKDQKDKSQQNNQQKEQQSSGGDQKKESKPQSSEAKNSQNEGNKPQPQEQANAGDQSEPKKSSQGNPEPNAKSDEKKAGQQSAPETREPGQMTKEEARRLLDSLKAEDRKVPVSPMSRSAQATDTSRPLKDW